MKESNQKGEYIVSEALEFLAWVRAQASPDDVREFAAQAGIDITQKEAEELKQFADEHTEMSLEQLEDVTGGLFCSQATMQNYLNMGLPSKSLQLVYTLTSYFSAQQQ